MRLFQVTFGFLALVTLVSGCQESPPTPTQQAFRVNGRLFVDSILAGKACVAFHPLDREKSQGRCPVARTKADGTFELTTYAMNDGAPPGDYTVTVTWPDDKMPVDECECPDPLLHDRLGGKYADPQNSPLLVTVLPRVNEVNLIALGAKPAGHAGFALPQSSEP